MRNAIVLLMFGTCGLSLSVLAQGLPIIRKEMLAQGIELGMTQRQVEEKAKVIFKGEGALIFNQEFEQNKILDYVEYKVFVQVDKISRRVILIEEGVDPRLHVGDIISIIGEKYFHREIDAESAWPYGGHTSSKNNLFVFCPLHGGNHYYTFQSGVMGRGALISLREINWTKSWIERMKQIDMRINDVSPLAMSYKRADVNFCDRRKIEEQKSR